MDNNESDDESDDNSNFVRFEQFKQITKTQIKIGTIGGAIGGFLASIMTMMHNDGMRQYGFLEFITINTIFGSAKTLWGAFMGCGMGATWFVSYPMFFASILVYRK